MSKAYRKAQGYKKVYGKDSKQYKKALVEYEKAFDLFVKAISK